MLNGLAARNSSGYLTVTRWELHSHLRSPSIYLGIGAFSGIVVLLCISSFPHTSQSATQDGVIFAKSMLATQRFGLWMAAAFVLPVMTVLGIHKDIQSGNREHLMATQLTAGICNFGKASALLAVYFLAMCAVLPVCGVAFFLAGEEVQPYIAELVVLGCYAVGSVTIAALIAAEFHTAKTAVATATLACSLLGMIAYAQAKDLSSLVAILLMPAMIKLVLIVRKIPRAIRSSMSAEPLMKRSTTSPHRETATKWYLPDSENPVARKDRHLLRSSKHPRMASRLLFLSGCATALPMMLSVFGLSWFFSSVQFMWSVCGYLHYIVGATVAAIVFSTDGDRENVDALRSSLLTQQEFFRGKIRAAWRLSRPALAGALLANAVMMVVYLAMGMIAISIILEPLIWIFHLFLMIPLFYATLLLAAAGSTFGPTTATRIASAMALSAAGHLIIRLGINTLVRHFLAVNGMQALTQLWIGHLALQVALIVLLILLARWVSEHRFRRIWRGADR